MWLKVFFYNCDEVCECSFHQILIGMSIYHTYEKCPINDGWAGQSVWFLRSNKINGDEHVLSLKQWLSHCKYYLYTPKRSRWQNGKCFSTHQLVCANTHVRQIFISLLTSPGSRASSKHTRAYLRNEQLYCGAPHYILWSISLSL